ncbi:MAG: TraB/GumN family protein, partial [Dehalococcoidales bacterium]
MNKTIARISLTLLSILLLFSLAWGCGNNATSSATDTTGKLFIWKISSDTTYVYLLGSVPVDSPSKYPLNSVIENAFTSADKLVVGVDVTNIDQNQVTQYLNENGMYATGDGFKNNTPAGLYNQLLTKFQKFGSDLTQYNDYKPNFWNLVSN